MIQWYQFYEAIFLLKKGDTIDHRLCWKSFFSSSSNCWNNLALFAPFSTFLLLQFGANVSKSQCFFDKCADGPLKKSPRNTYVRWHCIRLDVRAQLTQNDAFFEHCPTAKGIQLFNVQSSMNPAHKYFRILLYYFSTTLRSKSRLD